VTFGFFIVRPGAALGLLVGTGLLHASESLLTENIVGPRDRFVGRDTLREQLVVFADVGWAAGGDTGAHTTKLYSAPPMPQIVPTQPLTVLLQDFGWGTRYRVKFVGGPVEDQLTAQRPFGEPCTVQPLGSYPNSVFGVHRLVAHPALALLLLPLSVLALVEGHAHVGSGEPNAIALTD
jgi:hypothetical protein